MSTKFITLFVILFNLLTLATPAFADAPSHPIWESMAGEFKCGYATKYDDNAVTIETAAQTAASNWDECETQYGVGNCSVVAKGFSVGPKVCDYAEEWRDAGNGGLTTQRANRLFEAFAALRPAATDPGNRDPNRYFYDSAVKKAYLVIRPKPDAVRVELQVHACNDDIDNDGDNLVDYPSDPGCESALDDDEWNLPTDMNVRWADLVPIIVREAATPCPVTVTGWWSFDDRQFHYKVEHGYCLPQCRTSDVSPAIGYQMLSSGGIAKAASTHSDPLVIADANGRLNWKELRRYIEAPEGAPSIEYVDQNGTEDKTMWFGRAADVTDRGDLIVIDFKSVCQDVIEAEHEESLTAYGPINGYAGGTFTLGAVTIPDGSPFRMNQGTDVGGNLEVGIILGGSRFGWKVGGIAGVSHDPNCLLPATLDLGAVTGMATHRSYNVGFAADVRYVWSSGAYNTRWLTNKHRVAVGIGPSIHPHGDRELLGFNPQLLVGVDFVAAATESGIYTLTERRWLGVGLTVYKSW